MLRLITTYFALMGWLFLILIWPVETNSVSREPQGTSKEGLYKASITDANFGMLGFEMFETNEGRKSWHIKSEFAELYRKDNFALMKKVNADFFAQNTGNVINATSDHGSSKLDSEAAVLEGNVAVQSKHGYLFEMPQLNYQGKVRQFFSKDTVSMRGPSLKAPIMFLKGVGLTAIIDDEHFLIHKNVKARRRLKTSEWLYISSRASEFFADQQKAIFKGQVKSLLPKTKIDSDVFEIEIAEEKESLLAKGNVLLETKNKVATAETAYLEVGSDKIVLEGNAQVDTQSNRITGKKIILYPEEDKVEVISAEGRYNKNGT